MSEEGQGAHWDRIERRGPDNFALHRVDLVEAMRHLDPAGAFTKFDLDDHEGMAMRAALDLIGQMRSPPVTGNAAIRVALKDYLVGLGTGQLSHHAPRRPDFYTASASVKSSSP